MRAGKLTVFVLAATAALAGTGGADYPTPSFFVEMQPPTPEDWYNLQMRRMRRANCDFCGPIAIPGEIRYYPCPSEQPCGQPIHQSFKGKYGSVHPMPYYLPTPEIVVRVPGRCEHCARRHDWRFRQELSTPVEKIQE